MMENEETQKAFIEAIKSGKAIGISPNYVPDYSSEHSKAAEPARYYTRPVVETKTERSSLFDSYGVPAGKLWPGAIRYYYMQSITSPAEFQEICEAKKITIHDEVQGDIDATIFEGVRAVIKNYRDMKRYNQYMAAYSRFENYDDPYARERQALMALNDHESQFMELRSQNKYQNRIAAEKQKLLNDRMRTQFWRLAIYKIENIDAATLIYWIKGNVIDSIQQDIILEDINHSRKRGLRRKTFQLLTDNQRKKLIGYLDV
jgi:hypothetical protein